MAKKFFFVLFLFFSAVPLFSKNILLKSGETIKGEITGQDAESIIVIDKNGVTKSISKKKILKVVYKDTTDEELAAIRKEEERKLALKSEKESKDKELELEAENQRKETERLAQNLEIEKADLAKSSLSVLFTPFASNCTYFSSQREWFWLYGTKSFSDIEWDVLLPNPSRPVRIIQTADWKDTLISIFIGSITSITRKTRVVEVCELGISPKPSKLK